MVAPAQASSARSIRPLTILAVDDDAMVLMTTVAMLEDLGHTVLEANSGHEALEILKREGSIDLVVTDQAMPKMTGTELAKAIKDGWPDIPVLLATGYGDRVRRDEIGLPKLTKPYLQRDLANAIAEMNSPRRKPRAGPAELQFGGDNGWETSMGNRTAIKPTNLSGRELLAALRAFRKGNFSVRLPTDLTRLDGEIADAFNDVIELNERMSKEIEGLSHIVGKQGKIGHRAKLPNATGSWAANIDMVNDLIGDMVQPSGEMARVIGAVAKGDLSQTMNL